MANPVDAYEAYVDAYPDVLAAYHAGKPIKGSGRDNWFNPSGKSKSEWGQWHWAQYGVPENRKLPDPTPPLAPQPSAPQAAYTPGIDFFDYKTYVDTNPDLAEAWNKRLSPSSFNTPETRAITKEAWGKEHYDIHGKKEGRYISGPSIPEGRYSEPEFAVLSAGILTRLNGDIQKEITQIQGVTAANVANIQGGYSVKTADISAAASKYMADRDLEAKRYLADQDFAKATKVTEIEGKNRLDLQSIINTGLKEVEGIRGESAKEVSRITGELGVKQEEARQAGQKDIARIGEQAGYRNALINAFSF